MILKWEVDNSKEQFRHRITTDIKGVMSEWFNYKQIAILEDEGRLYFAVTKYYEGCFPTEQILKCEKLQ